MTSGQSRNELRAHKYMYCERKTDTAARHLVDARSTGTSSVLASQRLAQARGRLSLTRSDCRQIGLLQLSHIHIYIYMYIYIYATIVSQVVLPEGQFSFTGEFVLFLLGTEREREREVRH